MKRSAGILLGFLVLGVFSGSAFARLSGAAYNEVQAKTEGQEKLLVAMVSDAEAEAPELIAVWLLIHAERELFWIPIYPQPLEAEGSKFARPHEALRINLGEGPLWEGVEPIREAGAAWEASLVVDIEAVQALSQAAGIESWQSFSASWQAPQRALGEQVGLIQAWCGQAPDAEALDLLLALQAQGTGVISDWGHFEWISRWDRVFGQDGPADCRHPWAE